MTAALLAGLVFSGAPVFGVVVQINPSNDPGIEALIRQADHAERQGDWNRATEYYGSALAKERGRVDIRRHYQLCLRRAQQDRRHRDASFRQQVASLSLNEALALYCDVLAKIQSYFVDADKLEPGIVFRDGLDEYRTALTDLRFVSELSINPAGLDVLRSSLLSQWQDRPISRIAELPEFVRGIAVESQRVAGVPPSAVILEFLCGACALDEHSGYLTPLQLKEIAASWKGKAVTTGMEVALEGGTIVVSHVVPGSSAHNQGIRQGDRIVRVGDVPASRMTAETTTELLRGEAGTTVIVVVAPSVGGPTRPLVLKRQAVQLPSISQARFLDERLGVGYLRIYEFRETTVQELDNAIAQLQASDMKVLLLDLRGNEGGLFEIAVQVAERFISAGLIVSTHGPAGSREYNHYYYSRGTNLLTLPVVVLVDGETASAAELVAGALKDHQRGTLVGQTTFGKGCMQKVFKLNHTAAGLRLTVAKFYSPRGRSYTPHGVTPDLAVDRSETTVDLDQDPQLQSALEVARPLALAR
jgi:carboxyl-terminal processing protease